MNKERNGKHGVRVVRSSHDIFNKKYEKIHRNKILIQKLI